MAGRAPFLERHRDAVATTAAAMILLAQGADLTQTRDQSKVLAELAASQKVIEYQLNDHTRRLAMLEQRPPAAAVP